MKNIKITKKLNTLMLLRKSYVKQEEFADFLQEMGNILLQEDKESMTGKDLKKAGSEIKDLIMDVQLWKEAHRQERSRVFSKPSPAF